MEKKIENNISRTDVIILCGGLGKRIKSVSRGLPKPLADINGRPFIDIIVSHLAECGFKRFIFCTGYRGDMIRGYFSGKYPLLEFVYSHEEVLLGTAGAIKHAEGLIRSDVFLVLNGDSFCHVDFDRFMNFHLHKKRDLSIVLVRAGKTSDTGAVTADRSGKVVAFNEKGKTGASGFVNAGIYLMHKEILSSIPNRRPYSLEYDLFPKLVNEEFYGYPVDTDLLDIGTPAGYRKARNFFKNKEKVKS